jgi:predicted DNA-binding transcriptional regulator AlpA
MVPTTVDWLTLETNMKKRNITERFHEFINSGAKSIREDKLKSSSYKQRFFDVNEVAEYLHISTKTVYNRLSLGTFPIKEKRNGKKLLFEVADVIRYADSL